MLNTGRDWWEPRVRGILALVAGLALFMIPAFLAIFFAAYVLLEGAFLLVEAFKTRRANENWRSGATHGVVNLGAGVLALLLPAADPVVLHSSVDALFDLRYLIAAWAFLSGALEVASAIRVRRVLKSEGLLVLSGILSMSVAAIILIFSGAGLAGTAFWIGMFLIASGIALVLHSTRLYRQHQLKIRQSGSAQIPPTRTAESTPVE